ncbi:Peroxiredoxin Bcp [bioreactor metagenome]|uniref:Peroxiredoxin Bcp n=2 Tax=root TaxID=1 RepID=A0A645DNN7_9ZZZZ
MNELKVGDLAPKFVLSNNKGEQVSLEELKGKQILLSFYPVAFTPV